MLWCPSGDGQDRIDDEVHRDDVDYRVGSTGKVGKRTATESEDDGLGHPEALDPSRIWVFERALDDRRPDDRQRSITGELQKSHLGERLGERVHIRPSKAAGALPSR